MADPEVPPRVGPPPSTDAGTAASPSPPNEPPPDSSKKLLKVGSGLAGLGVAAEVLGHVNKIQTAVVGLVGLRTSKDVHLVMTALVTVLIVAGLGSAAYWILKNRNWPTARHRRAFIAVTTVLVVGATGLAWAVAPAPPEPRLFVRKQTDQWSERLKTGFAGDSGGTLVSFREPDGRTQAWTTAQALKAIFASSRVTKVDGPKLWKALDYMHRAQVTGGRGWGYFEEWPIGVTEIAGWVALAYVAALDPAHEALWDRSQRDMLTARAGDAVTLLLETQQPDGGWGPTADRQAGGTTRSRTYSTLMATWALAEAAHTAALGSRLPASHDDALKRGVLWLTNTRDDALGWVPNPARKGQNEDFPGLDTQVMYVLLRVQALEQFKTFVASLQEVSAAKARFLAATDFETRGLGDNGRLHDNDRYLPPATRTADADAASCICPFTIEGSTFLWYPWSLAAATHLAADTTLTEDQQIRARTIADTLAGRLNESGGLIATGLHYIMAEFTIGTATYLDQGKR